MYGWAILFPLLNIILVGFEQMSVISEINDINSADYNRADIIVLLLYIFLVFSFFILWIYFAATANRQYHKNVRKQISIALNTIREEKELKIYLKNNGGVYEWVIWLAGALLLTLLIGSFLSFL